MTHPLSHSLLSTRRTFVVVLVVGWFALAARNVVDPDVWWHLKTGEWIVDHHAVPHTDPFSFTRFGQPWVAHEWLSDVITYVIFRATGWAGLIATFAALVAAAFFVLYLRAGPSSYVAGIVALLGAWATAPLWGVRPQIISLLLTSIWLLILERSERETKILWWTVPLTLLWVNLHAGFALGLALLALVLIGETIERILTTAAVPWAPRLKMLGIVLALDLLIVPLNPNGAKMYGYPFETLGSRAMQSYISEWASPNFHRPEYWPLLFLILATAAATAWSSRHTRPRDLVLLSAGIVAALSSARLMPFFVLVSVPIVAKAISDWLRQDFGFALSISFSLSRPPSSRKRTLFTSAFNAAVLGGILIFAGVRLATVIRHQPKAEAQYFPASAVSYLQAGVLSDSSFSNLPEYLHDNFRGEHFRGTSRDAPENSVGPTFNFYDWGGYLIWKLYPATRVFIDGRADLYGGRFLQLFADTYQLKGDWRRPLQEWQVRTVIVPASSALAQGLRLDSDWVVSYEDRQAVIFHRDRDPVGQLHHVIRARKSAREVAEVSPRPSP